MSSDHRFKPQYEDENVRRLYRKVLKYVVIPRYRDIVYFFLLHGNMLHTIASMSGDRHLILVEVINDMGRDRLLELSNLFSVDFVEFLNTKIGRKLMQHTSLGTVTDIRRISDFMAQIQQLGQEVPELQELLSEIAASGIPVILPLSIYRLTIFHYALRFYELYESMQYRDKVSAIIDVLSRENLVEPIYQVEICPREDCAFIKTSVPADPATRREYRCPKCSSSMTVIKVYAVDPTLSALKLDRGNDLPIFIREYLRFRSFDKVRVYGPCTYGAAELDVVIPDKRIGIECKLTMRPVLTEHDVRSQAGSLKNDLEKYWNASLDKVILVTNLEERSAKMLEDELQRQIPSGKTVRVIHGDANALISVLDALI